METITSKQHVIYQTTVFYRKVIGESPKNKIGERKSISKKYQTQKSPQKKERTRLSLNQPSKTPTSKNQGVKAKYLDCFKESTQKSVRKHLKRQSAGPADLKRKYTFD